MPSGAGPIDPGADSPYQPDQGSTVWSGHSRHQRQIALQDIDAAELVTAVGRPLPDRLGREITREIERLAQVQAQIVAVEQERDQPVTSCEATEIKRTICCFLNRYFLHTGENMAVGIQWALFR